jgi:hypothetical protein
MSDLLVPFLVFIAALLAAVALFWGLRNRTAPSRRQRVTVPQPPISHPAARLPELAAVAAIPAPRGMSIDDTGPIPVISDVPVATVTDSGAYRLSPESGTRAAATRTRSNTALADTGSERAVADTGSEQAVSDSGSHRPVSTSGSHRMPRSRRARHSMRR